MKTALIHPSTPTPTLERTVEAPTQPRLGSSAALEPLWAPLVIRLATAGDRLALDYLAELDSAEVPGGTLLLGELRGRPVVAVSLSDGGAIADPFVPTSEVLQLVRLRARQLHRTKRSRLRQRAGDRIHNSRQSG